MISFVRSKTTRCPSLSMKPVSPDGSNRLAAFSPTLHPSVVALEDGGAFGDDFPLWVICISVSGIGLPTVLKFDIPIRWRTRNTSDLRLAIDLFQVTPMAWKKRKWSGPSPLLLYRCALSCGQTQVVFQFLRTIR